jgi:undecaprenyl-diphosphatase
LHLDTEAYAFWCCSAYLRGSFVTVELWLKAIAMGLVEGFSEFLPVSSTGHLILAGSLLGFGDDVGHDKARVFEIAIQTGAILAVIWVYWRRLMDTVAGLGSEPRAQRFALNVAVAFIPAAVMGVLFGKAIKAHLFTPMVVATTFILGAFVILWAERRQVQPRIASVDQMTVLDAFKVGLVQCFAMVPGTSRSGATIIGGMLLGLSRQAATEFSFFLAIPTLIGAGGYALYKDRALLSLADLPLFGIGLLMSFLSAWVCVRWLLRYVSSHNFVPFAWYRIAFGLVVLGTAWGGWVEWKG